MQDITAFLTLFYAKGACQVTLNRTTYAMQKGDLLLSRENIPFTTQGNLFLMKLEAYLFDDLFYSQIGDCRILYEFLKEPNTHNEHLYFHTSRNSDVSHYMALLQNVSSTPQSHHDKLLRLKLVGLFTVLDFTRQRDLVVQNSTMISENRFGRIMKYIGENYATCTLQETAERFGYHPDYLSTRFKKITGETFSEKLLHIRMEQATHLLLTSDLLIEEISSAIGFRDKSWFMHKFKEIYHMTPSQYRKTYTK